MKKRGAICFFVFMCLCFVFCGKIQADAKTYEGFEYEVLKDGTIEIRKYSGSNDFVEIPAEIEGKKVTVIQVAAFTMRDVQTVKIPASVTSIKETAFRGCDGLKAIHVHDGNTCYSSEEGILFDKNKTTLIAYPTAKAGDVYTVPESVTRIEPAAFEQTQLKEVRMGNRVASIGYCAFSWSENLEMIVIPESVSEIRNGAFNGTPWWENWLESQGDWAVINGILVAYQGEQSDLIIPENVVRIGENVFAGLDHIKSIVIPRSVVSISDGAFRRCTALERVVLSEGLKEIGTGAFSSCESLKEIQIPDSVVNLGESLFGGSSRLEAIHVGTGNAVYASEDGVLFQKDKTRLLAYPKGKPEVSYVMPESVVCIETAAFMDCKKLQNVSIPEGVTDIRELAFYGCENLGSVTIPESVAGIGGSAFALCSRLKDITILNRNCVIGKYYGEEGEAHKDLEPYAISDTAVIYGYKNSTAQAYAQKYHRTFVSLAEKPVVPTPPRTGELKKGEKRTVGTGIYVGLGNGAASYQAPAKKTASVVIPAKIRIDGKDYKVTQISSGAFKNCTKLKKVTIGSNVKEISSKAFFGCKKLKTVTIQSKVLKKVGKNAWKGIAEKAKIKVPKAKLNKYKKLLKGKGQGKKVRIVK